MDWIEIVNKARSLVSNLDQEYKSRLEYEIKEIEKQAASEYWVGIIKSDKKYENNKNGLVLPFLMGVTQIDPIKNGIRHNISYQPDFPDIDTDFLPYAREHIKAYASEQYGHDKVCTVGNWNTFKLKQAIQDACRVLNGDLNEAVRLTKNLNDDEYDEMTIEELCQSSPDFEIYYQKNREIIDLAMRLKGRIKSQGKHAGGIVISSHRLADIIPMSFIHGKYVSQWTEGMAAMQLSKFGLVKFDILGLKTMAYNVYAEKLIKESRGITIDWSDMNPMDENPYVGHEILSDGTRRIISFNDPKAIKLADEVKTEAVFQLDTPVAKRILANGVRTWTDLMVYTAMGRPGPIEMIPEYVARRDDERQRWKKKEDSRVIDLLSETYGVVVYQEQLTTCWMKFGGLTSPEAEKARKAVAKKKADEVAKVNKKVLEGMLKRGFDPKYAEEFIAKLETFGRYAFNKSHCAAYTVIMYRSLYLKAHYTPEFWAAILTYCHPDKRIKYLGVAKQEGVEFQDLRVGFLDHKFCVNKELKVIPSIGMIKGVGEAAAKKYSTDGGKCTDIDDFVSKYGKSRHVMERLIRLGIFDGIHPNRKAVWTWFLYKYGGNGHSDVMDLRAEIDKKFLPSQDDIKKERKRQTDEFVKLFPKKKIPKKISEWMPKVGYKYPTPTRDQVMELITEDFTYKEKLSCEKQYIGTYWSSPMVQYYYNQENTFENAKIETAGFVDGVVDEISTGTTKKGTKFTNYSVTDGNEIAVVKIWNDGASMQDKAVFEIGRGVRMSVQWNDEYKTFSLCRNTSITLLKRKYD